MTDYKTTIRIISAEQVKLLFHNLQLVVENSKKKYFVKEGQLAHGGMINGYTGDENLLIEVIPKPIVSITDSIEYIVVFRIFEKTVDMKKFYKNIVCLEAPPSAEKPDLN